VKQDRWEERRERWAMFALFSIHHSELASRAPLRRDDFFLLIFIGVFLYVFCFVSFAHVFLLRRRLFSNIFYVYDMFPAFVCDSFVC